MIVQFFAPGDSETMLTSTIERDRPTRTDPDGSRWCECDPEPHAGSGKPAVMGIPVADYCPRIPGTLS